MKVLLIDDKTDVTQAIEDRLRFLVRQRGYRETLTIDSVHDFYDARTHIEQKNAENSSYDIIISDLLMPKNGLETDSNWPIGPVLNGWSFLCQNILLQSGKYYEQYKENVIIIFSAYKDELNQLVEDRGMGTLYNERITFVEKGRLFDKKGGYNVLIETVESYIFNSKKEKKKKKK